MLFVKDVAATTYAGTPSCPLKRTFSPLITITPPVQMTQTNVKKRLPPAPNPRTRETRSSNIQPENLQHPPMKRQKTKVDSESLT